MIEIRNVSKKYKEKIALANCNLQILRGRSSVSLVLTVPEKPHL